MALVWTGIGVLQPKSAMAFCVSSERDVKTSDSVVISGRAYRSQVVGAMAFKATVRAIFT